MKRILRYTLLAAAVAGAISFVIQTIHRASANLVTLNVRRMPVEDVLKKVQRQTWETVLAQKEVSGPVTLNVRSMPLEKVLELIAAQTSARPSVIYPLYSSSKSLTSLKQILRGETASNVGWTNLHARAGIRSFGGPRTETDSETNETINLRIVARDLQFTTFVLNRLANIRVVPEDGTAGTISLTLDHDSAIDAVEALARKTNRKWTQIFTLRGERGPGSGAPGRRVNPEIASEQTDERRAEREVLNEQILSSLSDEDRAQAEEAQLERQKEMAEMKTLTPEQRREAAMERAAQRPDRTLERLKNSTPEQRAAQRGRLAQFRSPLNQTSTLQ